MTVCIAGKKELKSQDIIKEKETKEFYKILGQHYKAKMGSNRETRRDFLWPSKQYKTFLNVLEIILIHRSFRQVAQVMVFLLVGG